MADSEREWIIGTGERTCRQCDTDYRSLSQHWAKSLDCDYRPLSDHQHETIRGLLLGDGSLGGAESPNLRVESVRRAHLEWLHDELGWLSRGVSRYQKDGVTVYRCNTMSHPELTQYLPWRSAPPQSGWTLTQQAARIWYACDGSLSAAGRDGGTPQITFAAMDEGKRQALASALGRAGFDSQSWDRRVGLPSSEVREWFQSLGGPTPGSTHKWCLDKRVIALARDRQPLTAEMDRTDRYRALCTLVAEALALGRSELTRDTFDDALAMPTSTTIADWLGGGSWDDAKTVAKIPIDAVSSSGSGRPSTYSVIDIARSIRMAANARRDMTTSDGQLSLSVREYQEYRESHGGPSMTTVIRHCDSWPEACAAAGIEPASDEPGTESPQYNLDNCWLALRRAIDIKGPGITIKEYDEVVRESDPSWQTVCVRLGGESGRWQLAKRAVVQTRALSIE